MNTESDGFKKLFPKRHIVVILTAVFDAGSTIKKESPQEREDSITRRLHGRLIRRPLFRDGPLTIELQPEIPVSDPDVDPRPGKIDLKVPTQFGYEVYFAIEAKRLRVRYPDGRLESGNGKYVNNGMMRFITGRYAPKMDTGAMLGYVFDGPIVKAYSGLDDYLSDNSRKLKMLSTDRMAQSKLLPSHPLFETHHDITGRFFKIFHLFLAV